ncbi:glycosyltransferase, partial [Bacillus sp. GbtcB14]|uniref:glycosyltransferase n=1 Tax=Bacillus sp. GbtcB14 TaxID=2824759 RepID=UPI001C30870A
LSDLCDPWRDERQQTDADPAFLVSVLTPTYNTRPDWLNELYRSLANQTYGHWEWVICDDASSDPDTLAALRAIAANDERVRLKMLPRPGGIS